MQTGGLRAQEIGQSSTASLSNTVCFSDPDGEWPSVEEKTVEELSQFGEIARLDTSLALVLRCILVTYFDVRCAQRALLKWASRTEPFLPAAHDCRIVRVKLQAFAEKMGGLKGFGQFGEVANISMHRGDAIVEFYDMRAAQFLLASVGNCATPWTSPQVEQQASVALRSQRPAPELLARSAALGSRTPSHSQGTSEAATFSPELQSSSFTDGVATFRSPAAHHAPTDPYTDEGLETGGGKGDKGKGGVNRPVRTKVTSKEFQKFDIDPQKIEVGEDQRTTVMIRNLSWASARKDFLAFLEMCGLAESYTFFYMPCKEHRNVPAGFAFLNLYSPPDVLRLYLMVTNGGWGEFIKNPSAKAPAVSYARFQGHEALAKHFSSSAVLHEQDPDKRPIFKMNAVSHKDFSEGARHKGKGGSKYSLHSKGGSEDTNLVGG